MKYVTIIFALIILTSFTINVNYKASYRLVYQPDSTNSQRIASENFFLYLNKGESSVFASESRFKSDSIKSLIDKGLLPKNIQLDSKYRFKTAFTYFVCKDYVKAETMVHEAISVDRFIYTLPSKLNWKILAEQGNISGYLCTKATTNYAGRDYEAWFTTEVPIADGPYVFSGLPGLVVKLNDTRNHYVFVLQNFQEYKEEIMNTPIYMGSKPVQIERSKIVLVRAEFRKDRLEYMSRRTDRNFKSGTFTTLDGVTKPASEAIIDRSWDNNPLELK
jgi:GLPGLI family protein